MLGKRVWPDVFLSTIIGTLSTLSIMLWDSKKKKKNSNAGILPEWALPYAQNHSWWKPLQVSAGRQWNEAWGFVLAEESTRTDSDCLFILLYFRYNFKGQDWRIIQTEHCASKKIKSKHPSASISGSSSGVFWNSWGYWPNKLSLKTFSPQSTDTVVCLYYKVGALKIGNKKWVHRRIYLSMRGFNEISAPIGIGTY